MSVVLVFSTHPPSTATSSFSSSSSSCSNSSSSPSPNSPSSSSSSSSSSAIAAAQKLPPSCASKSARGLIYVPDSALPITTKSSVPAGLGLLPVVVLLPRPRPLPRPPLPVGLLRSRLEELLLRWGLLLRPRPREPLLLELLVSALLLWQIRPCLADIWLRPRPFLLAAVCETLMVGRRCVLCKKCGEEESTLQQVMLFVGIVLLDKDLQIAFMLRDC